MDKQHLIEIYKVEAEKYNATRDIHWKMNTALWTAVVVAIYAKYHSDIVIEELPIWSKLLIALPVLAAHAVFINTIHGSLDRSLKRMNDMATILIDEPDDTQIKWVEIGTKTNFKKQNWKWLQIGVTVLLLIILMFFKKA